LENGMRCVNTSKISIKIKQNIFSIFFLIVISNEDKLKSNIKHVIKIMKCFAIKIRVLN